MLDYRSRLSSSLPRKIVVPVGKLFRAERLEASKRLPHQEAVEVIELKGRRLLLKSASSVCNLASLPFPLFPLAVPLRPLNALWLPTMSATSAAMPKAAALPARLLRTSRQCSKQSPAASVRSATPVRSYHVSTAPSTSQRLRDGVRSKHNSFLSSRVGAFCNLRGDMSGL